MAFTYDVNTKLGKLRLMLNDVDPDEYIFEDEELSVFLSINSGDLNMAASTGWSIIAGDKSKQAIIQKSGQYSHNLRQVARECREQANLYKQIAQEKPANHYIFKE